VQQLPRPNRTSSLPAAHPTPEQRVPCSQGLFIFISTSTICKGNFISLSYGKNGIQ